MRDRREMMKPSGDLAGGVQKCCAAGLGSSSNSDLLPQLPKMPYIFLLFIRVHRETEGAEKEKGRRKKGLRPPRNAVVSTDTTKYKRARGAVSNKHNQTERAKREPPGTPTERAGTNRV